MSLSEKYFTWLDHLHSNTDYVQVAKQFFHDHMKSLGLDKAKSMISIGAGEGILDTYIIKNCTPELCQYIGIEPDKASFDKLTEAMSTFSNTEVILFNEGLPGWKGPREPVDIVLFSNVLYYVPDQQSALRQSYEWLKPGGSIIIVHSNDDNVFVQIGKTQLKGCKHMPTYYYDSVKKDLDEQGLPYFEGKVFAMRMMSDFKDEDILKQYFKIYMGDHPDEQMAVLIQNFSDRMENTCGTVLQTYGSLIVTKPTI